MRANMAELTAKMKRWRVRVALDDDAALVASGSQFALLRELLAGPRTTLLMVLATGAHHFNALDQLSRVCTQQRVWSAVLKPSAQGVKHLVVYVPRFSSAEKVAGDVQRLAHGIQLSVAVNVVNCDAVPRFVMDGLILSIFIHELEIAGCTIVGDEGERQVVLSPDISMNELSTVIIPHIQWQYDPYHQSCFIEMTCVPVVMRLKTIAEDAELDMDADEGTIPLTVSCSRVRVLPLLSEGWMVSRLNNLELIAHNARPGEGDFVPRSDEEFRSYWFEVHGIHLPQRFGGYVRVRFSSNSVLTYPACCVTTEWNPLFKQTRTEALDVLREFAAVMRQRYGQESVTITSPDDQVPKTAVLLPASALLPVELSTRDVSVEHRTPTQRKRPAKRRMITRDRYNIS